MKKKFASVNKDINQSINRMKKVLNQNEEIGKLS